MPTHGLDPLAVSSKPAPHASPAATADPATPQLGDFLAFAEARHLSANLRLRVGTTEIGNVVMADGAVVHADLPGAQGDDALRLMARLPAVSIDVTPLPAYDPSVTVAWRDVLCEGTADVGERLHHAFGLATVTSLPAPTSARPDFDELWRRAMRAYAARDYADALELFEQCSAVRPDDARVAHNLRRLRDRLHRQP